MVAATTPTLKVPAVGDSPGAPGGYAELRAFLPTVKQRATALGVTDNTVVSWDRGAATRVRKEHQARVGLVLETLHDLAQILGTAERAGRTYTSPLPLLQDLVPARLVLDAGREGADVLTAAISQMQRAAERAIVKGVVNDEALWAAFESSLSDASRSRRARAVQAVKAHRASTGGVSALD